MAGKLWEGKNELFVVWLEVEDRRGGPLGKLFEEEPAEDMTERAANDAKDDSIPLILLLGPPAWW